MKYVYACLIGEWVNLSKADNLVIDNSYTDANSWYKENIHSLFDYDYINIEYSNKLYRISPHFIQIVTE